MLPRTTVQPHKRNAGTLGTLAVWACAVSLAATPVPSYFLRVREMFQFPGLPPPRLCVHRGVILLVTGGGFPIRTSSAPSLHAAPRGISLLCHVLHRHPRPRHPPHALRHGLAQRGVAPVAHQPCPHSLSTSPRSATEQCPAASSRSSVVNVHRRPFRPRDSTLSPAPWCVKGSAAPLT